MFFKIGRPKYSEAVNGGALLLQNRSVDCFSIICQIHEKQSLRECLLYKVSTCQAAILLKKRLWQRCFPGTFCKILSLYTVLYHNCLCSFPLADLQEAELCQIYSNTYSSFSNFYNKQVSDVDLKVVINKDQSNNIHDIYHFEEIMDKKGAILMLPWRHSQNFHNQKHIT